MAEEQGKMIGEQDVTGWIRSSEIDRSANYLQRGRFHAHLSDETLTDQWILAAKAMCLDTSDDGKRQTENDLKAELDLRGMVAPFDAIQAELQIFHERFAEGIERTKRDDPEAYARVNAQLAGLIGDFQDRKASSQN